MANRVITSSLLLRKVMLIGVGYTWLIIGVGYTWLITSSLLLRKVMLARLRKAASRPFCTVFGLRVLR